MSDRYKGALLSPTPPTVTLQSANGVYTLSQQFQYDGQAVWPTAVNNPVTRSLRFRSSASAYLNRTPASATNRQTWTWSGWVKLGLLNPSSGWNCIFGAYSDDNNRTFFYTNNNSVSNTFYIFDVNGGSTTCNLISTQVLRDVSAWYHLVVSVDTTQATSSNRIKVYLNGSQITSFGTASYPSQNANLMVNNNVVHYIGASRFSGINLFHDGYLAEVNFIDGTALTPSSFGTTDAFGIWQPIPYTGAYGTNGFYLPFTDNSALTTSSNVGLGKDFSGNGNYWVTNNISITSGSTYDSMTDVPTNTNSSTANYCVLNPLDTSVLTASNGNLTASSSTVSWNTMRCTMGIVSGKFYWEYQTSSDNSANVGIETQASSLTTYIGNTATGYCYNANDGKKYNNGTSVTYGATYGSGDVIGVAFDANAGTLEFYKNGTSQGVAYSSIPSGIYFPAVSIYAGAGTITNTVNFGQRPFAYTPPTGYNRLCTYNLPEPSIPIGNQYMDATLYTGNATARSIANSGSMQPDFVWIKNRTSGVFWHQLYDSIRGPLKGLFSNETASESTYTDTLTAFNSTGFNLGTDATFNGGVNKSGDSYVAWQWKANGSGSSNTNGSITSTVSANTTAGFSIVTFTTVTSGTSSVGHGLGVAPNFVIFKTRGTTSNWICQHTSTGTQYLLLNGTGAATTDSAVWNSAPTSSIVNMGTGFAGYSGATAVMYCFAQVAGYSAFGSYTGNGSSDGPFVYLGFRPRYVLLKRTDSAVNWMLYDTARDPYNVAQNTLNPNLSDAEGNGNLVDILSNGFKLRDNGASRNASGGTYIYAAFAENPFKIARAR